MKNVIKFLIFLIYTILIFFINKFWILSILFFSNLILALILKIKLKDMLYNLKLLLPFVLFTSIINIIIDSVYFGLLIGFRIVICYNITYIFSKTLTVCELADVIQKLCYPLKLFKVNTKNIGIMVSVALCMIPIFKNEFLAISDTMKAKGMNLKLSNTIIIMKPIFISVLRKTGQIEKSFIAKGYSE